MSITFSIKCSDSQKQKPKELFDFYCLRSRKSPIHYKMVTFFSGTEFWKEFIMWVFCSMIYRIMDSIFQQYYKDNVFFAFVFVSHWLCFSERADPSYCKDRITEGANINKSLVTLGIVISTLGILLIDTRTGRETLESNSCFHVVTIG